MRSLLALFALVLIAPLQDQSTRSVVGHFDWPVGTVARVNTEYVRQATVQGTLQRESRLRMQHRMRVLPHAEGRLIEYYDQLHLDSAGDVADGLMVLWPNWVPGIVVSLDGRFIRTERTERLQELVATMYAPLMTTPAVQSVPRFKELLQRMTSGDGVTIATTGEWHQLVGKWRAAPLDTEVIEVPAPLSLAAGVTVESRIQQRMIERGPCTRAALTVACASFELKQTITPEGLAVLGGYMLQGSSGPPGPVPRVLNIDTTDRITLEVGTMLPHEISVTRTRRQAAEINGETIHAEDLERRTVRFTYVVDER
jgi:hypothetical protein